MMRIRPDPDSQDYWDQDKFPHLSSYVGGGHLRDMQSSWQYIKWLSFLAWKIMPGTAALNQSNEVSNGQRNICLEKVVLR